MSTYVPHEVQKGLDAARLTRFKSKSRLRIETQDGYFRLLRLWDTGFSVALEDAPHLRGFVDVYEGPTHHFQCLIVTSREEADEMQYEFKRMTAVQHAPARDFAADVETPAGLLGAEGASL